MKRFVVPVAMLLLGVLGACEKAPAYSQKTPDETIATARLMIERGEAKKLTTLIYADSADMRAFLEKMAVLFTNLQKLADAVQKRFPEEVAEIKKQAEEKGSEKISGLIGDVARQANSRRRQWDPKEDEKRQRGFEEVSKQLFADPYGWLQRGQGRLSTESVTDDMVSLRWDGKAILAPFGVQMRRSIDENWYFVLPLNLPGLQNYLPRNEQEWKIFGSMIAVINNTVVDLRKDVESGRIRTMNDLSRQAGEKAFMPAAMVFVAYSKAMEARKKEATPPAK